MEFKETRPIYLQIADHICEKIASGSFTEGERIPSVRDLAEEMEVNPNTVLKTYAYLERHGIIHKQRGTGFYVSGGAKEKVKELQRERFFKEVLPEVFLMMDTLGITPDELIHYYTSWKEESHET